MVVAQGCWSDRTLGCRQEWQKAEGLVIISLKEAEGRLGRLIDEAAGQEVVIESAGGRTVRLVPRPQAEPKAAKKIGHALDRFMGTWTAEEEAEFLKTIEVFEQVDESLWPLELSVSEVNPATPSAEPSPFTLEGFLERITDENLHQEVEAEPEADNEVW